MWLNVQQNHEYVFIHTFLYRFGVAILIYEIYSFDFDGCLANLFYLSSEDKNIILANKGLLDALKSSPNPKIILVGSNRQGLMDDYNNALPDKRGSCFPAVKLITRELNTHEAPATLDEFLLSDVYNDLADGTSFKMALRCIDKNKKDYIPGKLKKAEHHPNWMHDESKLTVLYAQIHKIAKDHPLDDLQFNFIDDREDILDNLHNYFLKYPELIPHNVTLHLKKYIGPYDKDNNPIDPIMKDYAPLRGTRAEADADYKHTVKIMAAVTIEQMNAKDYFLTATLSRKSISSYEEAKRYHFNTSTIKVAAYYEPGMLPDKPPEYFTPKKSRLARFGSSFFSSRNLLADTYGTSSSSPRSASMTSSSSDPRPGFSYASSSTSNTPYNDAPDPAYVPQSCADFDLSLPPLQLYSSEEQSHEISDSESRLPHTEQQIQGAVKPSRMLSVHRLMPPREDLHREQIDSETATESSTDTLPSYTTGF